MLHDADKVAQDGDFVINSDEIKVLVDIGFLAASRNITKHANAIFNAVMAARPQLSAGYVGMAYTWLGANEPQKALDLLAKAPMSIEGDLFSAIALSKLGQNERAARLFEHVVKYGADPNHILIAESMLSSIKAAAEPKK